MKASVVIPVYNKAPFLRECLDSVFAQTLTDFEVIAVDDASIDNSVDVLRSYTDPRLTVVALPANRGPAGAAQHGMDMARAPYIVRVDADDILLPERLAQQVAFLDSHPEIGVLGTAARVIGDRVQVRQRKSDDAALRAQLLFGVAVFQPTSAYRTAVLRTHGVRYDAAWPRYGEDWLFQVRLAAVTRFANLPQKLVTYRHGPQGISFGLDRAAAFKPLLADVFHQLALPTDRPDAHALHAMAMRAYPPSIDPPLVAAFKAWLDGLAAWNIRVGWCPPEALQPYLDRAWDDLFPRLPRHGLAVVNAYRRAGGRMSPRRWYYVLRTWMGSRALRTTGQP